MSLGEAIISTIIILIAVVVIISAAKTSTVVKTTEVPDVNIVWQQRLVHNAINNPYINLSEDVNSTDPDVNLVLEAGSVPYTPVDIEEEAPAMEIPAPEELAVEIPTPEKVETSRPSTTLGTIHIEETAVTEPATYLADDISNVDSAESTTVISD